VTTTIAVGIHRAHLWILFRFFSRASGISISAFCQPSLGFETNALRTRQSLKKRVVTGTDQGE
jgi:hypothetical protein